MFNSLISAKAAIADANVEMLNYGLPSDMRIELLEKRCQAYCDRIIQLEERVSDLESRPNAR